MDESSEQPARGGINKDTASPCFSPHHYLHQQAAELAVQVRQDLIKSHQAKIILNRISNFATIYLCHEKLSSSFPPSTLFLSSHSHSFPQATDHYLNVVLEAVGNDKYRRLFDLYDGSALSIVIDTTSSMSGEIHAVKAQVAEIVASIPTEMYILVPYNDPC